ncbi:MAG: glucokinase [Deltaproteobacteria bacterium]|nr:glucokinase [Deltaproteobacteria bacterium]MBW1977877.1 glucokinase [Deltaproteobacteria bacterium]MBW2046652.1 glucokinase [Deltaproteobacteria bacterium]MBW2300615.1 glucokinase [Deltaproteobacteria bacterium]
MKIANHNSFVLAGDIGGTKTSLGIFACGNRRPRQVLVESWPSRDAPNLEWIVERFLQKHSYALKSACFGIAGPVVRGKCKTTNLPWEVSGHRLKERFGFNQVKLINDLAATARAVPLLHHREVASINRRRSREEGNMAILAPGTGLGEAIVVSYGESHIPIPSEGGHIDFSPANEQEVKLWVYLRRRFGHVSFERIVSGPGLVNIYSWLRATKYRSEPQWLRNAFKKGDHARVIAETALAKKNRACEQALRIFVSILGRAAGNLALTVMATGGVFLAGGIPPKILPALREQHFLKSFTDKGRFEELLRKIPVRVILNQKAALLGAARCACER